MHGNSMRTTERGESDEEGIRKEVNQTRNKDKDVAKAKLSGLHTLGTLLPEAVDELPI